jgi:hypothetical protein
MDSETEIRVNILEQMYEYHWYQATVAMRCLLFAQDHYTYRDQERAHLIAAEWVAREHMGILHYKESQDKLRPILDRVKDQHKALVEAGRIADEKPVREG